MTRKNELSDITNSRDAALLGDLFHALTQPLTTLRCSLDLSWRSADREDTQRNLEVALQAAESVSGLVAGIRELVEDAPTPQNAATSLEECLRDVIEYLRPVAGSMGISVSLASDLSLQAAIEPRRLRQGLSHLLEFALISCQPGQQLQIKTATDGDEASLTVLSLATRAGGVSDELQSRLVLGIARRIFESAGGSLEVQLKPNFALIVHLPLARKKSVSKEVPTSRCCA